MVVILVAIIAGGYGIYLFNKEPVDTRDYSADFEIDASDLINEFSQNEELATKKYSDKILIVTGPIKEINAGSSTLFLDASDPISSITCSFYANEVNVFKKLKLGDVIHVKGKCTGKLIDVVINNCSITNTQ